MSRLNKKIKRRIIVMLPFAIAVTFLLVQLVDLTVEYNEMRRENATVKAEIKEGKIISEELEDVISKLNDPDYLKSYAKENYLYSEDDSIIIRIPEDDDEEE